MNEYHLIVSYDHFRWKSSGGSIIRCVSKLKVVNRPLSAYGKLARHFATTTRKYSTGKGYQVELENYFYKDALQYCSLRLKATLGNFEWRSKADIYKNGKLMTSLARTNPDIFKLTIDKLTQLQSLNNQSKFTVQVQCYKRMTIFHDSISKGISYNQPLNMILLKIRYTAVTYLKSQSLYLTSRS